MEEKFDISQHELVPLHIKLNDEEKEKILNEMNISEKQLPAINEKDMMVKKLNAKVGDVIKIIRKSPTMGTSIFYRVVVYD
ncbi:MAG: DNA-directed RNA polymerase subunit H [Nanoarchaeota archaeon]|nr:DNA-directed RNA polymerase subunit H [Nanoarchaeota archaeon]MBU0963349.1 DNA-directed RNA polymerase subunit H [Nanoarchaeota archaeon]